MKAGKPGPAPCVTRVSRPALRRPLLTLERGRFRPHHLLESIIRIVMIDRRGGYELVLDKNRGRYRTLVQNVEAHANQVFPVPLGEVGHGSDETSLGFAEFHSAFPRCILPHNGARLRPAGFLKGAQRTQSTGIINASYQHVAGMG